jgi:hypothetical protein
MQPQLVDSCSAKVSSLPVRDQVRCVMLAVNRCAPLTAGWLDRQRLASACRDYAACLERWLAENASDTDLEKAARPIVRRLNRKIEYEDGIPGAMAAHALLDTEAIALGYSPEVGDEIIRAAVLFCAAAYTGRRDIPVEVDADRLSPQALQFIEDWWRACTSKIQALRE